MTASVRLFSYGGVRAIPLASNNQYTSNACFVFAEPYLASAALTASNSAVSTTTALSPAGSAILRVEVQKGNVIHYEITHQSATAVVATTNSPTLEGKDNIEWGPGYTLSVLLAGAEA